MSQLLWTEIGSLMPVSYLDQLEISSKRVNCLSSIAVRVREFLQTLMLVMHCLIINNFDAQIDIAWL